MGMEEVGILVVGGGSAGLATAWHLVRMGRKDVLVLDREDQPGFYSSGHNAAIGRQLTGRDPHTALTRQGREQLASLGLLDGSGGYLLGAAPGALDAAEAEARRFGIPVERRGGSPYPDLVAAEHLWIPGDGVIDIDGMLRHCAEGIRAAGGRVRYGCAVRSLQPAGDGFEVETDAGRLRARILVNAAGGWAQVFGRLAGGLDIPFRPLRRHLVWSGAPYPPERVWTWWVDRPFYMRPESGGLLMCPLDESLVPLPARGQQPPEDAAVLEGMARTLVEVAPGCEERPVNRLWSGLRTFAPDRQFVIGRDPVNSSLYWVAGLGGHGMTGGFAIGELAARCILEGASAGELDPARLARKDEAED